jgi:small-conductance mechanosensitive channel
MLAFACHNFLYHVDIALIAGLQIHLLLFFMFIRITNPNLFKQFFNFWQLIQFANNFIHFLILIDDLDFIIVKIFYKVYNILLPTLIPAYRRLLMFGIADKRCLTRTLALFGCKLSQCHHLLCLLLIEFSYLLQILHSSIFYQSFDRIKDGNVLIIINS